MNAFNRNTCLEDTRVEVLNEIMDWLLSDTTQNILWLHGVAGCGKSAIATTIAEYCREMSRLGAFVFFRRADGTEDQLISLFRTIAFQLVMFDSSIVKYVKAVVKKSDHVTEAVAEVQFKKLLLDPLTAARDEMQGPVVIILDALDECGTPEARRTLMTLLRREFGRLPPNFRFLITSRPEADINVALSPNVNSSVYELALDSRSDNSRQDVLRYIDHEISVIFEDLGLDIPDEWGTYMDQLAEASEGLFIWASTAINLIKGNPSPFDELESIVGKSHLLRGLDRLYGSILRSSGVVSECYPASITHFCQIFGLILLSNAPLSDTAIDSILGLSPRNSARLILSKLRSVIAFTPGEPVHLLHTSFADYLLSKPCPKPCLAHKGPSDCLSGRWFIDESSQQSDIAMRCFIVMEEALHFNMCDLESSFIYNKDVTGIEDRINKKLTPHLQYACKYWAQHVVNAPYSRELLDELTKFARKRLLYWFEAIGLLGLVRSIASRALLDAAAWSEEHDSDISSFLRDASRLASTFTIPMTESVPHIYVSMLPLMKDDSEVAAHYLKQTSRMVEVDRIGTKRPPLWLKVLEGHLGTVQSVSFSPDGECVASGSDDRTARIWNVESGEVLCEFSEGNGAEVNSVVFSPDGRRIAFGTCRGTISIWDIESKELVSGPFKGHTGSVRGVAFSPDGMHITSGSADTTIRVWDIEKASTLRVLEGHTASVWSVAFSSDGNCIVSGSEDKTLRVWDPETGQAIGKPFVGHTDGVQCVAISPDCKCIVSGSNDFTVRVWGMESEKVVAGPFWHLTFVKSVAFSSDGRRVVSASDDFSIVVWDMESGDIASGPFTGHTDTVISVAFSPDGSRIVSGSRDKTVRLWDAHIGKMVSDTSTGHTAAVMAVAFSPDGSRIVSGANDKTVRIWDANTAEAASAPFEGHTDHVNSVAFRRDGKQIVSGSEDKSVIVWDVESGKMVFKPFKEHVDIVNLVAFSPDGTRIVSGSRDRTIIIWNAENGNMIAQSERVHGSAIGAAIFSPDGAIIASVSVNNDVVIWNTENGKCSGEIVPGPWKGHNDTVTSIAFSPDGVYLVSGSEDRKIIVWNASNGNIVSGPYEGHSNGITCVALSPDGSRIVSCSWDTTIRIWNVPGKEDISSMTGNSASDAAAPCSSMQDVNGRFASWTLSDNGWVLSAQDELLLWLPPDIRPTLWRPQDAAVFSCEFSTKLNFRNVAYGKSWRECFNRYV
ncbi:WD40 repeat-like protein [Fomitiporia mediterranea MF3/22]|uniref:WD40 repeat-like protein n=1 Tax=Fomitiporia mediterranea (strain MF3/22) TaxID=694068 RepID=UPI00044074D9|nr:WD40 repeat-like protein [Fomitiporia mediterranea MF3/22]EJC99691.1 WD40 repeat-like protein [Fomitiporia mediterranea MF3/22]